ncbi:hypothetical protein BKA70DRAFT_33846 [Coprinopsis sp. MPI-PUGE-AT-0042]|nr:hypothetical protein BKA70DRAFT_33846 [Coprinopsis sp. MPI-PUGE-AT-0042]
MTDRPPQAFLFWDDSAFPNASSSGYEVAKAIQVFAANIGTIKSLRFYADVAGNQALSPALCSELQCAGVSIIDTVSAGRQGAASKMLLADVFIQALDDPAPCSVMIVISADPDLSYPISALRLRNRRVVLVCPSTVDPRFLQSADGTILEGDLLETRMPASASLQRSTDPPLVTSLQAIPSHFQVMIDLLNDAKSFRGITVYERGLLSRRLLELRPTIFEEAGLSKFVDPMAEYIDRAIASGIVRSSTKHGIQLMPTFQAVVPYNSTLGCCSEKTDEESAGEATFVRQEEEALDGSENSTTDQTSEPMRQPEIPPRASFAEDQALPLLGSIDSSAAAEEAEPIPIAREAQSPYLFP